MDEQRARHQVMMALTELSEVQREVLILDVVNGYTVSEMASFLDLPYNTVYPRLKRARTLFDRALSALRDD
jgi:DNA-directed RNA polymerase specialized sigma24 family protein